MYHNINSIFIIDLLQENAVHKKLELKELLQVTLNDLIAEYNMNSDYADQLVRQHNENIRANEETFNEEVARQRMVLEERLTARRAMIEEVVCLKLSACIYLEYY